MQGEPLVNTNTSLYKTQIHFYMIFLSKVKWSKIA
uniref:Uncharacterized protein n=1 Tax=Anguilla anguilla TaxID=7936 RepID=A0A0E9R8A5_ANGAN